MVKQAERCPMQRFVFAGFSQGAMAIHKAVVALASEPSFDNQDRKRVDGIVLLADGYRKERGAGTLIGTAAIDGHGISDLPGFRAVDVPAAFATQTYQVCDEDDLVCDPAVYLKRRRTYVPSELASYGIGVHLGVAYKDGPNVSTAADYVVENIRATPKLMTTQVQGLLGQQTSIQLLADVAESYNLEWRFAPKATIPSWVNLSASGLLDLSPGTLSTGVLKVQVRSATLGVARPWVSETVQYNVLDSDDSDSIGNVSFERSNSLPILSPKGNFAIVVDQSSSQLGYKVVNMVSGAQRDLEDRLLVDSDDNGELEEVSLVPRLIGDDGTAVAALGNYLAVVEFGQEVQLIHVNTLDSSRNSSDLFWSSVTLAPQGRQAVVFGKAGNIADRTLQDLVVFVNLATAEVRQVSRFNIEDYRDPASDQIEYSGPGWISRVDVVSADGTEGIGSVCRPVSEGPFYGDCGGEGFAAALAHINLSNGDFRIINLPPEAIALNTKLVGAASDAKVALLGIHYVERSGQGYSDRHVLALENDGLVTELATPEGQGCASDTGIGVGGVNLLSGDGRYVLCSPRDNDGSRDGHWWRIEVATGAMKKLPIGMPFASVYRPETVETQPAYEFFATWFSFDGNKAQFYHNGYGGVVTWAR